MSPVSRLAPEQSLQGYLRHTATDGEILGFSFLVSCFSLGINHHRDTEKAFFRRRCTRIDADQSLHRGAAAWNKLSKSGLWRGATSVVPKIESSDSSTLPKARNTERSCGIRGLYLIPFRHLAYCCPCRNPSHSPYFPARHCWPHAPLWSCRFS